MATDSDVKKLLARFSIDTSDWKKAVQDIKSQLSLVQLTEKKAADDRKKQLTEEAAKTKQAISDQRLLTEETRAKITWEKQVQEQVKTTLLAKKQETAEIQKQITLLRLKIAEERASRTKEKPQQGVVGKALGSVAGIFGGGLTGGVVTGVLAGEGILAGVEGLAEGVHHLLEKFKELIEETGPLQQVREQFEKLAAVKSINAVKFLEDLRSSTRGLVNDITLYRIANNAMQGSARLSEDQILRLTTAVTDLARAQGQPVEQAMQRMQRAFISGRMAMLGFAVGVSRADLTLKNIPRTVDSATKATMEATHVLAVLEARVKQVGVPAETFTERLQQVKVASNRFFEEFGHAIVTSPGFGFVMDFLKEVAKAFTEGEPLAKKFGQAVGVAIGTVAAIFGDIVQAISTMAKGWTSLANIMGKGKSDPIVITAEIIYAVWLKIYELHLRLSSYMNKMAGSTRATVQALQQAMSGDFKGATSTLAAQQYTNNAADREITNLLADKQQHFNQQMETGKGATGWGASGTGIKPKGQSGKDTKTRLAQETEALRKAQAKAELEDEKYKLDQIKQMNEEAYKSGLETIDKYLTEKQVFLEQELADKKKELEAEKQAKLQQIQEELNARKITAQDAALKSQTINIEYRTQEIAEERKVNDQIVALKRQAEADKQAAERARVEGQKKLRLEESAFNLKQAEEDYKQGKIGIETLLDLKKKALKEDLDTTLDALSEKEKNEVQSEKNHQDILNARLEAEQKYQQKSIELQRQADTEKLKSMEKTFHNLFSAIGSLGLGGKGFLSSLSSGGGVLTNVLGLMSSQGNKGGFGEMKDAFSGPGSVNEKLSKFANGLDEAAKTVGGFVSTISQAQSPLQGAIGGGLAGAGMGMDLGKAIGGSSAMAGPIGAAVGSTLGIVMGVVAGEKQKKAKEQLDKLTKSFNDIVQGFNEGTVTLGDAIRQLQAVRDSTIQQMQHSKKKEKQQFQSAIDGMNQQIQQLRVMQARMLKEMHETLAILTQPEEYQDFLGTIEQIIKKYDDFKGAAANAKDLADANQYLTLSLQKFANTQGKELASAEMSAIQNAIQLNDLIKQRSDLVAQEQQQEYDIMTKGVLVRQQTEAMSKMSQIAALRDQTQQQLDRIDQETKLAQFKYDAESKIFSLATTRIDLETQLLLLQQQQFGNEMQRIVALQNLVNLIRSGTPIGSMQDILNGLGLSGTSNGGTFNPLTGQNSWRGSPTPIGSGPSAFAAPDGESAVAPSSYPGMGPNTLESLFLMQTARNARQGSASFRNEGGFLRGVSVETLKAFLRNPV